ncbi:MAG: cytochrome-c peroxidase [Pseudomonadota bacterium]
MRRTILGALFFCLLDIEAMAGSALDAAACDAEPVLFDQPAELLLAELGRDLFYDPILSGNKTVACATCHHPAFGTSDGVSLSLGDGGLGIGPSRRADADNLPERRIPRNAQSLFNLGYPEFSVMFHDGRVERLQNGLIRTPLGNVKGDHHISLLAALSGLPVISADEMAGHYSENPVSQAVRRGILTGPGGARQILAERVAQIAGYRDRFARVFGDDPQISFDHIAQALAAFMAHEWRADDSPFDRFLCHGDDLPSDAAAGMKLFYGKAGCSDCHAGRFQTDHGFHAVAMPQIGPGKSEIFETHSRDIGRMRVTGDPADAYKFKTPSLRNVVLTAPYGHAGAYSDLVSVIRHHLDPAESVASYDRASAKLPALPETADFEILESPQEVQNILAASELTLPPLSNRQIDQVLAFLKALTDRKGLRGRLGVPETVPSGLPVPRP